MKRPGRLIQLNAASTATESANLAKTAQGDTAAPTKIANPNAILTRFMFKYFTKKFTTSNSIKEIIIIPFRKEILI